MDGKNLQRAAEWLRFHGAPLPQRPTPPAQEPLTPVQAELARIEQKRAGLKD